MLLECTGTLALSAVVTFLKEAAAQSIGDRKQLILN